MVYVHTFFIALIVLLMECYVFAQQRILLKQAWEKSCL